MAAIKRTKDHFRYLAFNPQTQVFKVAGLFRNDHS